MNARACLLYARYSSDRQNPLSCEDQLRACREYARRAGWRVAGEYRDEAVSGARGRADRRGWDQLLTAAESGLIPRGAVVLVWDLDRWSRDWRGGMAAALALDEYGIALADLRHGVIDQSTLAGKIMLALGVGTSDEFRQKLQLNVRRGLEAGRREGRLMCSPPYGYRVVPGRRGVPEPDPLAARRYREAVRRVLDGESVLHIVREWNRRGIPSPRGRVWRPLSLREILLSPFYVGMIPVYDTRRGGKHVNRFAARDRLQMLPGRHKPLIDRDTWERARAVIMPGPQPKNRHWADRPLSGLVICEECGRACYAVGGAEPYRYYRCRPYGLELCGSRGLVRIDRLEEAVRGWVRELAADGRAVRAAAKEIAREATRRARASCRERGPLEAELAAAQARLDRLVAAIAAGEPPAALLSAIRQEEARLIDARARLDAAGAGVAAVTAAEAERVLRAQIAAGAENLRGLRQVIDRIVLPAERGAPPTLQALGRAWTLRLV